MAKSLWKIVLGLGALMIAGTAYADTVTYVIALPTAVLTANAASGPFYLDFQLFDGSGTGDGNNQVLLSNFQFGGGSALGAPLLTGGASGNFQSVVALSDSGSVFTEALQQIDPGSNFIFRLTATTAIDAGGTPDELSLFLLDGLMNVVPTTDGVTDRNALVVMDLDGVTPMPQLYAGTDSYSGLIPALVTVVPEAGTGQYCLLVLMLGLALGAVRRHDIAIQDKKGT